ncbi:peptide-methionine (R)-S-oxide reductase MsrB [Flavobacteriaceae bacterium]|nr:peptide-methionine (R)-S-oxide reductase MsrB [Flavobacteriaceae bacterium]
MKKILFILLLLPFLASCQTTKKETQKKAAYAIQKTDAEWKDSLPEMAYYVLRQAGTERPFTGEYNSFYKEGTYVCAACKTELYYSKDKFDSKTGWPSFDRGATENIEFDVDYKLGYARTELKCNTCGGHLGHMFNDGPRKTTGKRHCINSAALTFITASTNE